MKGRGPNRSRDYQVCSVRFLRREVNRGPSLVPGDRLFQQVLRWDRAAVGRVGHRCGPELVARSEVHSPNGAWLLPSGVRYAEGPN
jgi:hypothetical protein